MNYNKIYNNLIDKSKNRIVSNNIYFESHHIIPRCMGGKDNVENICLLTPEEHYLAHQLLIKIYPNNNKLIFAAICMTVHTTEHRINNKIYGWLKRKHSIAASERSKTVWKNKKESIKKNMKKSFNTPENKKKKADSSRHAWKNAPESRREQIRNLQKLHNKKLALHNKKLWETEDFRKKMKLRNTGSNSIKLKEKWANPIWKAQMLENRIQKKLKKIHETK